MREAGFFMQNRVNVNRIVWASFGLGVCVFFSVSLYSFSIYDWPNPDVLSTGSFENLCGPMGAYLAYFSNYYLGPATIPGLIGLAVWLILYSTGRKLKQMTLRIIGVALTGAALAAGSYLISHGGENSLSHGNGGVVGIALGHFLLVRTAMTGTILVLVSATIVGLLLAADNVVVMLLKLLLRSGVALAGISVKAVNITSKTKRTGLATVKKAVTIATTLNKGKTNLDDEDLEEESILHRELTEIESESEEDNETKKTSSRQTVSTVLARMIGPVAQPSSCPAGANSEDYSDYSFPPLDLLEDSVQGFTSLQEKVVKERARMLEQTLAEFNLDAKVVEMETGPVITMFELKLAPGIKVSQISNLSNDLGRSLGASAVRVVAPIPGKHTIGIEVPNSEAETVRIRELLRLSGDRATKMQIPLFLGKDASGNALVVDLTSMPHLLIAGTTGSGKSVCVNSIITSILLTQRPNMVKLILIDPKMVEMATFADLAHLMCPIVTEMKRAEQILEWLTEKMDERYALLAEAKVRHITEYNKLTKEQLYERFDPGTEEEKIKIPKRLPYLVVIVDELADLMMTSAKEVEAYIVRLAQKSRAVGIHLVLSTQRPQATVVTGLIKSNMPCRISFRVAARMDSRIVLDQNGAEALMGRGDMLFLQPGTSDLVRAQGTFIDDKELNRVVKYLKEVAVPNYHPELVQIDRFDAGGQEKDELFDEAVRMVLETKRGSVSLLQRRLTIGYSRASRLIDQMAAAGIVGEYKGSQAREVLITLAEYETICKQMARDAAAGYRDLQEEETEPVMKDIEGEEPEDGLEETDEAEDEVKEEEYEYIKEDVGS